MFGTVSALKSSDLWVRTPEIHKLPSFRLARFVAIFDGIHSKLKAAGKPDAVAEATALSLAYAAAVRFQPMPATARLESKVHFFSTMMPVQFSMGGEVEVNSFDYLKANLDIINVAVGGNGLNIDHDHSQPTGMIHRIHLPNDAAIPAEVRAAMDPDTPFVVAASFYEDTPDAILASRALSAEWLRVQRKDGTSEVLLPDSFCVAVSADPATEEALGVRRLSTAGAPEKAHLLKSEYVKPEATMPADTTPTPENASKASLEELRASMTATVEKADKARVDAEQKLAKLDAEHKATEGKLAKLAALQLDREANDFAGELVKAGKARTEDAAAWAKDYKELGAERVASIASRLPVAFLGESEAKAASVAKTQASLDEATMKKLEKVF